MRGNGWNDSIFDEGLGMCLPCEDDRDGISHQEYTLNHVASGLTFLLNGLKFCLVLFKYLACLCNFDPQPLIPTTKEGSCNVQFGLYLFNLFSPCP